MEVEISSLKGRREMKKHPGSGTEPHLGCGVRLVRLQCSMPRRSGGRAAEAISEVMGAHCVAERIKALCLRSVFCQKVFPPLVPSLSFFSILSLGPSCRSSVE